MKIAVVGTGYVGLVLGACLAENGNTVACVDKDAAKVDDAARAARCRSTSPASKRWSAAITSEERLTLHDRSAGGRSGASEIVFIAVGTPQGEDGSADLAHVLDVARATVGRAMNKYTVVVDKSTVPVGTARAGARRRSPARRRSRSASSATRSSSKQGAAVEDFMKPDRVVDRRRAGDAARRPR